MTPPPAMLEHLRFLTRVAHKASRHLTLTDARLFAVPCTPARVAERDGSPALAEQVDAFVSPYSRLQDTLGDKPLPVLLGALGEPTGAAIDNLDRAERLGPIAFAEGWMEMRWLRNQTCSGVRGRPPGVRRALETAHACVPVLTAVADRLCGELRARGWR